MLHGIDEKEGIELATILTARRKNLKNFRKGLDIWLERC